jgi:hypothetical protein
MNIYEIANDNNIRFAHFPLSPENKIYFFVPHRNNKGWSVLASYENGKVYITGGWSLDQKDLKPCLSACKHAIKMARSDYTENAKNFLEQIKS